MSPQGVVNDPHEAGELPSSVQSCRCVRSIQLLPEEPVNLSREALSPIPSTPAPRRSRPGADARCSAADKPTSRACCECPAGPSSADGEADGRGWPGGGWGYG